MLTDTAEDSCPATCSLRAALAAASANDEIQFSVNGTITLTQGPLVIGKSVTIMGLGASILAIDGNRATRLLRVNNGVTATINGLTIQNGYSVDGGGGITNSGTLTVTNCILSSNGTFVAGSGGAIANSGTATVTNSTFSGNTSISVLDINVGGAIANSGGTLTLTYSTLNDNSAYNGGGISNAGH